MSTKISISRKCFCCGEMFIAKTTVTKFCTHKCASRFYKLKQKEQKITDSQLETNSQIISSRLPVVDKEFLKVKDVAALIECTSQAVHAMINSGRLKATNLGVRMTRILKSDLVDMFEQDNQVSKPLIVKQRKEKKGNEILTRENCFSVHDLVTLFDKTREDLYTFLKRKNVPKLKIGKEVFYDREAVDKVYRTWMQPKHVGLDKERAANKKLSQQPLERKHCYSIEECEVLFNKPRGLLYGIFNRRNVPKLRIGQEVFRSKVAVNCKYRIN